jgi:hypothetical protein
MVCVLHSASYAHEAVQSSRSFFKLHYFYLPPESCYATSPVAGFGESDTDVFVDDALEKYMERRETC